MVDNASLSGRVSLRPFKRFSPDNNNQHYPGECHYLCGGMRLNFANIVAMWPIAVALAIR